MITEKEVTQAIEQCMQEPVTGNKRAVLADLIIIQDYLFGEPTRAQISIHAPRGGSDSKNTQIDLHIFENNAAKFV